MKQSNKIIKLAYSEYLEEFNKLDSNNISDINIPFSVNSRASTKDELIMIPYNLSDFKDLRDIPYITKLINKYTLLEKINKLV